MKYFLLFIAVAYFLVVLECHGFPNYSATDDDYSSDENLVIGREDGNRGFMKILDELIRGILTVPPRECPDGYRLMQGQCKLVVVTNG